jgi:hydrogenase maturation protein HypF
MTDAIISDKANNIARSRIAWKVFVSLAKAIQQMAFCFDTRKIAFSGGVFQNALLVDLIHQLMNENYELYFHQQLSPNDECIAYGQLAHYCYILNEPEQNYSTNKLITQN